MSYLSRTIAHFFSRPDKWEIAGFYALCATIFLMPFPRTLSLWTMGLFLFFGMISWILNFRTILSSLRKHLFLIAPPVLYFFLYLIYFLIGDHLWGYVEDKLMFLVVPLLGLPVFTSDCLRKNRHRLLLSLVYGILIICVYQFTRASLESIKITGGTLVFDPFVSPGVSRFVWDQLSGFEHPSYVAIKTLWVITLMAFTREMIGFRWYHSAILIVLLSIFIFFLAAKTELLILAILLVYILFSSLKSTVSRFFAFIAVPVFLAGFFWLFIHNSRVEVKIGEIRNQQKEGRINWRDFDPRTRSWFYSLDLIRENPVLGVGLDARNILAEEYKKYGYTVEAGLRLNSHNQYLETQLTLGLPGTLVLLWMLITPFVFRRQSWRPALVIPFMLIILISMISESILVRQWGIMFFVIFYCFLLLPRQNNNRINSPA